MSKETERKERRDAEEKKRVMQTHTLHELFWKGETPRTNTAFEAAQRVNQKLNDQRKGATPCSN